MLPFNAYGTMAIAREEFENNSGSSQFFWLLKVHIRAPLAARPWPWPDLAGAAWRAAPLTQRLSSYEPHVVS